MSNPFTPEQEKWIDEFLKKHSDLMDDLAKLEELEKQRNPMPPPFDPKEECEWIGDNKVDN